MVNLEELLHSLIVSVFFVWICELNVKCNWHEFKRIFFVLITESLHYVKQVKLLSDKLVCLEMVDHLAPLLMLACILYTLLQL